MRNHPIAVSHRPCKVLDDRTAGTQLCQPPRDRVHDALSRHPGGAALVETIGELVCGRTRVFRRPK